MSALSLLPVTRDDRDDLIRSHVDSRAYHQPWVSTFTDEAGFEEWFARLSSGRMVALVGRHTGQGGVVGLCTLSEIVGGAFQNAYLGFHGMATFARRGLMTEAVRMTARYAFSELGLHRLEANIQPGNSSSIALVRRVGFCKEGYSRAYLKINGVWQDHERWALLSTEI